MLDRTEEEIQRADRAAQLLAEPLIADTLALIEQEYIEEWKNSPARDVDGREKLWLMVKTVRKFQSELESVIATGQIAKHRLHEMTLAQQIGHMQNPSF